MVAQTGQTLGNYSLENIELEYETIDNSIIAKELTSTYALGHYLIYEDISLIKTDTLDASKTILNENINSNRSSMNAIVILLTKTTRKDSEEFRYPNITSVDVTIDSVPNQVYSNRIQNSDFYDETKRLFG